MKKTTLITTLAAAFLVSCTTSGTTQLSTSGAAPIAAKTKAKAYPLKTCIVTDNDLDSMGGEITKVYDNQEIKFCCKTCIKKFEANPAKYLNKL